MSSTTCDEFKSFVALYVTPLVTFACVVLNLACFLVFNASTLDTYSRSNMFQFLKIKSLLDALESSTRLAKLVYTSSLFRHTFVSAAMRILVGDYLKSVLTMLSILAELFADLNRLLEMHNVGSGWRKLANFRLQIGSMASFTCLVYTFTLFEKNILTYQNQLNETLYEAKNSQFGKYLLRN